MSNYDLNRHKKGDKVKWFFTGLVFFLVIITIVGMCLQLWGKGKVKPSEWFKHEETEQTTPTTPENENSAVVTEGESDGMLMVASAIPLNSYEEYGVSALAENAYTLTVTYTPENTTFQETTYSAKFKDGTDCSAFATISQSTAGSKTATLTVLKPFSQQIIVTATNNRNTAIKATTTVDYVCKTLNIDVTSGLTGCGDNICFTYGGWTDGTLTPTTNGTITFVYDVGSHFVSQAAKAGFTVNRYFSQALANPLESEVSPIEYIYRQGILSNYNSLSSTELKNYEQFLGTMLAGLGDGDGCGQYSFSYSRIYNGVDFGGFDALSDPSNDTGCWYDYDRGCWWSDSFEVSAQSISTNTPSIITG